MTSTIESVLTLPLGAAESPLALVGGKGASLASLTASGFPVPPGFQITTVAYRRFVAENGLRSRIERLAGDVDKHDPASLARAAEAIRAQFDQGTIPLDVASAIRAAYAVMGEPEPLVAVRSSATAEDLPGFSFAGQQETLLNVRGTANLLAAVRRCWASLWSARAIAYRRQMGVHADVAMAVVVQRMIPADVAGVLFTANPASGIRGELVIEAAAGLGEALVGGTVTPASYVLDRSTLASTKVSPGSQETMVVPDALLHDLARLGIDVEKHFGGTPQDIEWAQADGRLWLLQARPITNLPPAPLASVTWESPLPGTTWVRRQVVENMPEPLSPLFAELYLEQGLNASIRVIGSAMGVGDLLERVIDGPFFTTVHGYGYSRGNIQFSLTIAPLMLRALATGPIWLFRHGVDYWQNDGLPPYLASIARWQDVDPTVATDGELLRGVRELATADAVYWFAAAIAIGAAKVSDWIFDSFLTFAIPDRGLRSGQFLRGFSSKTLEAEAALDAIARRARASAALREQILDTPAERLLDDPPHTPAAQELRDDLARYFARYGHQIYNLDFVAPTLAGAPLPVLLGLKALVRDPGQGALARQAAIVQERDRLTAETERALDPLRRFLFQRLLRWARGYAPYREQALFYVGAAWPTLRRFALELGRRLVVAGTLTVADDVFYLQSGELEQAIAARAAGKARPDLRAAAAERRELHAARQRLHPPPAVPPTARLQVGGLDLSERETQRRNLPDATTLRGFAVSPGRVTAPASVILSPADFGKMEPGTILVCPTTTPAWTPLFAQARGLVTDIGGILAHGSIVAREYGIPAVMGTGNATQRIVSGQEIAVDGTAGTVTLDVARAMLVPGAEDAA